MKKCNKCNKFFPLNGFCKDKSSKDGLAYSCKICRKQKNKEYYIKNKARLDAKNRKYTIDNKEVVAAHKRKYYKKNKDKCDIRSLKWAQNNREQRKKIYTKWVRLNYDKVVRANNLWAKNNPDKKRFIKKRSEQKHPEARRARERRRRTRKRGVGENSSIKAVTKKAFQNKCANCGSEKNLSIDHHFPLCKNNPLTLQNAVVLCISCNSRKGIKDPGDFYTQERLEYVEKILKGFK